MKAITVHQPWASLIAFEAKHIETRGWAPNYRGPLAIHAGLEKRYIDMRSSYYLLGSEPFLSVVTVYAERHSSTWTDLRDQVQRPTFPRGMVIAICDLVDVVKIEGSVYQGTEITRKGRTWQLSRNELAFGNFGKGRFLWLLDNVFMLRFPVPAKGAQGLWEWKEPVTDLMEKVKYAIP